MSPLIKSDAGVPVRSFAGMRAPVTHQEAPTPDPREIERAQLIAEIERLQRVREEEAEDARRAIEAAREDGRREGLTAAERREDDAIAALREGLDKAGARFAARLDVLDGLAPELARTALSKLFADAEGWAAPVEAMLARQLAVLRRASVVAICVSPQDFPDAQALAAALGADTLRVETDRELRAGASRIECRLGQIDLDVREQWRALSDLLAEMAG